MVTQSSCSVKFSRSSLEIINFSGVIFISISQTVLSNGLVDELSGRIPNLDPGSINSAGATGIIDIVPADLLPFVLEAYNSVIRRVFIMALVLGGCSFIASVFFNRRSLKRRESSGVV